MTPNITNRLQILVKYKSEIKNQPIPSPYQKRKRLKVKLTDPLLLFQRKYNEKSYRAIPLPSPPPPHQRRKQPTDSASDMAITLAAIRFHKVYR